MFQVADWTIYLLFIFLNYKFIEKFHVKLTTIRKLINVLGGKLTYFFLLSIFF